MVKLHKNVDRNNILPYSKIGPDKVSNGAQKQWIIITCLIATYGFLKNISPESPYIAEYLTGEKFNFTSTQVTQEIYPVSVYSSVLQTSIVLFVTDILKYKPVIVVGAFGYLLHKVLLVWGRTLSEMQANQFFWGTSKACTLAYKTYIYNKVDREHYNMVTAIIRIAPRAGTLISSILSQVALSILLLKIEHLNIMSLVASSLAALCAVLLPSMKHSIYLNKNKITQPVTKATENENYCGYMVQLLWQDFKDAYTNLYILKWCFWWILATAGFQHVTDYYVQVLWSEISHLSENRYNAGVEALYTIISSICCYITCYFKVNWSIHGELVLGVCTVIKGVALLYNARSHSIVASYVVYIGFSSLYDVMMVITNSEVAKHLKNESFALIFGTNIFLALCCQSLLTFVLTSKYVLALSIREQFNSIGCGFLILGFGFAVRGLVKMLVSPKDQEKNECTPVVPARKISLKSKPNPNSKNP